MPLSVRLRRACVPVLLALLCAAGSAALDAGDAWAASALSPRHSGLEPPGGPKPMEGLPAMGNAGNTTERGMGYTDAYGRPLKDYGPEEVKPRKRPRGGAYQTGRSNPVPVAAPQTEPPPAGSRRRHAGQTGLGLQLNQLLTGPAGPVR